MARSAVIVNPARVPDADALRKELVALLAQAGWPEPDWWQTTPEDPGRAQAAQAVAAGAEVVFACGGDGTVMACVSALAGSGVALAVLPAGTGNLLAANLDLPSTVSQAVAAATGGGRRRIDVGRLDGYCFAVMAGMGFDAQMMGGASASAKARLGWAAYLVSGLAHLRERPVRMRLQLDDEAPVPVRARAVIIGNVGRLQAGLALLPAARPDDGVLDVAVLRPRTVAHWLRLAWAVLLRRPRVPRLDTYCAGRIEVRTDRVQPREADGEVIDPGRRLLVQVWPEALTLCVPAGG